MGRNKCSCWRGTKKSKSKSKSKKEEKEPA